MKYLIIGTGGVGGSIAGFLALAGKDVRCIARGAHLEAMQQRGLHLISGLKGEHLIPVKAFSEAEYNEKADVIFVCVKGYSIDSVKDIICKAAHPQTVIIPVLNVYGTGDKIEQLTGLPNVLDGCVYIVGFVSSAGEITQMGKVFRLIFGQRNQVNGGDGGARHALLLHEIQTDLQSSGIQAEISDNIRRDTFIKWSFISAMACTGAYYNTSMGALQHAGAERDTFAGLSNESTALGRKLGISIPENQTERNLQIIDNLSPESTASMQKDLEKGRQSEINELLFEFVRLAEANNIDIPTYRKVAQHNYTKI